MKNIISNGAAKLTVFTAVALLAGCTTVDFNQSVAKTNQQAVAFTQGHLALAQAEVQRQTRLNAAQTLLAQPLNQTNAVKLALLNSPSLQALLAQHWADAAQAAQAGRIANPVFSFERMVTLSELELGRFLSVGLLDILSLPQRQQQARAKLDIAQLQLTSTVIDEVTKVRMAWVKAVAAAQTQAFAQNVHDAAKASATLAQRMQAIGNFTKLQRARQQGFYAVATSQWAQAQQNAVAQREALVRLLGLNDAQAQNMRLDERLPNLPEQTRSADEITQAAAAMRLDVQMAKAELDYAVNAQGLGKLMSFTDIELGARRDTTYERADGHKTTKRGAEISIALPIFDWGDQKRAVMNAQTLAASYRVEATTVAASSMLRESYAAYRTAYDIAKHYRDEIVPLSKAISDENVLRYNGMFIGVFELLADTREQIGVVMGAINAQQQFWLADAALQATIVGKPMMVNMEAIAPTGGGGGDAKH